MTTLSTGVRPTLSRILVWGMTCCALTACTPPGLLQVPSASESAPGFLSPQELAVRTAQDTRIQPGDTLRIVRDAYDMVRTDIRAPIEDAQVLNYLVRPDGSISYPMVGRTTAGGLTPDELATALRGKLDDIYRQPGVTINIVASPSSKVVVGGAVRNPITIDLAAVANFEQALFAAGGLQSGADPARVALLRLDMQGRYRVYLIDFSRVLQPGAEGRAAMALQRGDILFVPKSASGTAAEAVDLYINQLLPFSRSVGVGFTRQLGNNGGNP